MLEYVLLRVVHVVMIAVWLGVVLGLPGMLKRGQRSGPEAFRLAVGETDRRLTLALAFSVLTLATGLIMIFRMGGFGAVHRNIHTSLGLVIAALLVQLFVTRSAVKRLKRVGARATTDLDSARPFIARVAASSGVFQLLWLVTLFLMYYR